MSRGKATKPAHGTETGGRAGEGGLLRQSLHRCTMSQGGRCPLGKDRHPRDIQQKEMVPPKQPTGHAAPRGGRLTGGILQPSTPKLPELRAANVEDAGLQGPGQSGTAGSCHLAVV